MQSPKLHINSMGVVLLAFVFMSCPSRICGGQDELLYTLFDYDVFSTRFYIGHPVIRHNDDITALFFKISNNDTSGIALCYLDENGIIKSDIKFPSFYERGLTYTDTRLPEVSFNNQNDMAISWKHYDSDDDEHDGVYYIIIADKEGKCISSKLKIFIDEQLQNNMLNSVFDAENSLFVAWDEYRRYDFDYYRCIILAKSKFPYTKWNETIYLSNSFVPGGDTTATTPHLFKRNDSSIWLCWSEYNYSDWANSSILLKQVNSDEVIKIYNGEMKITDIAYIPDLDQLQILIQAYRRKENSGALEEIRYIIYYNFSNSTYYHISELIYPPSEPFKKFQDYFSTDKYGNSAHTWIEQTRFKKDDIDYINSKYYLTKIKFDGSILEQPKLIYQFDAPMRYIGPLVTPHIDSNSEGVFNITWEYVFRTAIPSTEVSIMSYRSKIYDPTSISAKHDLKLSISTSTSSSFTFKLTNAEQLKPSLAIFDIRGRKVAQLKSSSETFTWNTASQPAGVYLVQWKAGEQSGAEKIVVVK